MHLSSLSRAARPKARSQGLSRPRFKPHRCLSHRPLQAAEGSHPAVRSQPLSRPIPVKGEELPIRSHTSEKPFRKVVNSKTFRKVDTLREVDKRWEHGNEGSVEGKELPIRHDPNRNIFIRLDLRGKHRTRGSNVQSQSAAPSDASKFVVKVEFDHEIQKYPAFWLRDHCPCSACRHPETKQRLLNTFKIDPNIEVVESVRGDNDLQVKFSDEHTSMFPLQWLKKHALGQKYLRTGSKTKVPIPEEPTQPEIEYDEVMASEQGVAKWTQLIRQFGYSFVNNVPISPEATQSLLERIAFVRHTHYGGFWDFTSDLASKDTAYTNLPLPVHTDTAYFTDPCGLQLFHLLSHRPSQIERVSATSSEDTATQDAAELGGNNLMVDGCRAVKLLNDKYPHQYEILKRTKLRHHSAGNDDVCIQSSSAYPVFTTTEFGMHIRWNNDDRSTFSWADPQQMADWYDAARIWYNIINDPQFLIETKFEPGRALIFNNWRMLHGRTAFTGERRMCGGYINMDDFWSRYMLTNRGREAVLEDL